MYKRSILIFIISLGLLSLYAQDTGNAQPLTIAIKAISGLQYDLPRFAVKPGTKVTITLTNADDMSHNLVVTKPGARLDVVNAALQLAEKGPQMNFIPVREEVLFAIPVVSPGQVKSVSFTAPAAAGVYPYVCTYPGHGFLMYGAMYVQADGVMPPLSNDINVPETSRAPVRDSTHSGHDSAPLPVHPYALVPPYLYRVFIEGASPAAIAVCLPSELAYCWDAGTCKLRFAWKGGFLDNTDLWKGHFDASARVLGDVFFRDNLDYPLRFEENGKTPVVKFKGYRLVKKYPEFHYTVNGLDVYEMIHEKADGNGLVRSFRIPTATGTTWFSTNRQDDAISYECSSGKWQDGRLMLTASEAKGFTITMTSYHLAYQRKKK